MKLNKIIRKSPLGVTLIELTVVIAVILTLISVLFIGASYYKNAANEAACIITLSSITKSYDAMYNIDGAYPDLAAVIAGPLGANTPLCPTTGTNTYAVGNPATCTNGHVLE